MSEKVFCLPDRPVICETESAKSTKLRIVYDVSAKASKSTVSLNECLETGSPLQNSLYDMRYQMISNETYCVET